jgi:hypothetical protein
MRNFELLLVDEFDENVTFTQGYFHIQLCVEMKSRSNN